MASADDIDTANVIRDETIALLKKGAFELHKWASNNPEPLAKISCKASKHTILNIDNEKTRNNETLKTLGTQ